jgi:hypothetical protein
LAEEERWRAEEEKRPCRSGAAGRRGKSDEYIAIFTTIELPI